MEKLGIINLSTKSAKLTIVDYTMAGYFIVEKEIDEPVNLHLDIERDGYLKPSRIEETIKVLRTFRTVLDFYKIDNVFCLAERSFLQIRNQLAFFDEIYKTLALFFKVADEAETMSSLHNAMLYSMAIPKGIVLDIEDEFINIIKYNRRMLLESISLPYGVKNIADNYLQETNPETKMQKMCEFLTNEFKRIKWLADIDEDYELIGVGEAFENAGKLIRKSIHYPLEVANNFIVERKNFTTVFNLIKTLDLDKSKKLKGISESRIDVLASGMAVIKSFFGEIASSEIHISTNGVQYGDAIKILFAQAQERPLVDVLGYSLSTIEEFYPTANYITDIYDVSIMLYKQLKVLHKLPKLYTKVLRIAASMSLSGKRVSYKDFVKNSFNVVLNSNIMGVGHKEIVLAAFVCATQDIDEFNASEWVRYKDIVGDEEIDSIKKLGIIIKMARSLCVTGIKNIKDITCDILGDTVILKTEVEHNAELEINQAMACANDFKKVYKKNLQIL